MPRNGQHPHSYSYHPPYSWSPEPANHGAPHASTSSAESVRPSSVPAKAALQFVQMTNTGELDAQSRRLVRAHVMKDYDKRLTAARKRSIGAEQDDVTQAMPRPKPRKRAYDGMFRWRPGHPETGTEVHGKEKGVRRESTQSSSTAKTLWSENSAENSPHESFESWPSSFSFGDDSQLAAYTDALPSSESKTWEPDKEELPGLISADGPFGPIWGLMDLLSPPVHRLGVGNGQMDPFNTLPVPTARTEVLVTHFHSRIMASSLMMSARKHWFMLATGDQALFLIAMSHAAGNLSLQLQKRTWDAPEALLLRTEAIRVINERILNVNANGPSDGTIGAVASMASYEATNGTPLSIRTHMSGLAQMVAMRGGLIHGIRDTALLRLILWADLNCANALDTTPYFVFPSTLSSSSYRSESLPPLLIHDSNTPFEDTAPLMLLPGQLAFALLDIRHLVKILRFPRRSGAAALYSLDDLRFSDQVYAVQRKLMDLTSDYAPLPLDKRHLDEPEEIPLIAEPAAIAGLIFVECILREIAPSSRIVGTLLFRLAAAIEFADSLQRKQSSTGSGSFLPPCQKQGILRVMIWVFAVGGTVAELDGEEPGKRGWWVRRLKAVVEALFVGCSGEADADAVLKSVVWSEGEGSSTRWMKRWKGLWQDVVADSVTVT